MLIKKVILLFLLVVTFQLYSQEVEDKNARKKDSISYLKNDNYIKERTFQEDLKSKYSGRDFIYKEEEKKEKPKKKPTPPSPNLNTGFFVGFLAFMKFVFPFLLGGIVIYIILKLYLGSDAKFWDFKSNSKTVTQKLVYEDEDIDNSDIDGLLNKAIKDKNTRLAIRYYYLLLLKKLSEKEIIKYDKDKTNSEYLFEIEDSNMRKQFSYLSYIYTYVWYGEFDLNEHDFTEVAKKYNSFFKTIN